MVLPDMGGHSFKNEAPARWGQAGKPALCNEESIESGKPGQSFESAKTTIYHFK